MSSAREKLQIELARLKARVSPELRVLAEQAVKNHFRPTPARPAKENLASRVFQAAMAGDQERRKDILAALEHRIKNGLN